MKSKRLLAIIFLLGLMTAVLMATSLKRGEATAGALEQRPTFSDPYLVKNINPLTLPSDPRCLPLDDQRALCLADDFEHGPEPWLTDGTAKGTFLLKEIMPGIAEDYELREAAVTESGDFFFTTYNYYHSVLWKSDGTTGGTVKVIDFCPQAGYGQGDIMRSLVTIGDTLYFAGYCIDDLALWKSEGTAGSTTRIVAFQGFNLDFFKMVPFKDKLYYVDGEGILYGEYRLWQSDGTAANTAKYSERSVYARSDLALFDDRLYLTAQFKADDPLWEMRWQLAAVDGTGNDIKKVADLGIHYPHAAPDQFTAASNLLFFFVADPDGQNRLMGSDGSAAGTIAVKNFEDSQYVRLLGAHGPNLYFTVNDSQLWTSDGSSGGTILLKQFEPWEYAYYDDTGMCTLTYVSGRNGFYLRAKTEAYGCELWKSDGSVAGTRLVSDIAPGSDDSLAGPQALVGDLILFAADGWPGGRELWTTDGTAGETRMLVDINRIEQASSRPARLISHEDVLYFYADDGRFGRELWRSEGRRQNTSLVKDIAPGSSDSDALEGNCCGGFASLPDTLVFQARNGDSANGIWSTQGEAASTTALTERLITGNLKQETLANNAFFDGLFAEGETHAIFRTDGTPAGTIKLADLQATGRAAAGSSVLYFAFYDSSSSGKVGLGVTDGTVAGTKVIEDLPECDRWISDMAAIGDLLLFSWCDERGVTNIWRLEGPEQKPEFFFNDTNLDSGTMVTVGERIFFVGRESAAGYGLWLSDGTILGTSFVGPLPGSAEYLYPFKRKLFFSTEDDQYGREAWVSDGTRAGTRMVKDIHVGQGSSNPYFATDDGRFIYFSANDGKGERIWASDGTESGTFAITESRLGSKDYEPGQMMVAGAFLFFTPAILEWEHSHHGSFYERELWAIDLGGSHTNLLPVVLSQ